MVGVLDVVLVNVILVVVDLFVVVRLVVGALDGVVDLVVIFGVDPSVAVRSGSVVYSGSLVVGTKLASKSTPGTKMSLLKVG